MFPIPEMSAKKSKPESDATAQNDQAAPAEDEMVEELESDFTNNLWSVVTFEECAASGLTYPEAMAKMAELRTENVSGLCIVTDEAAARIGV